MSDSDGDDEFNFQSKIDFDANQEEQDNKIINDLNFKTLSEMCNDFYDDLQKNDFFDHKSSWRTASSIDPIKIKNKQMALDMIMTFLDVIFGILVIFITIIIFDPINKTKKFKVKEDQLFLQKTLITTIQFTQTM